MPLLTQLVHPFLYRQSWFRSIERLSKRGEGNRSSFNNFLKASLQGDPLTQGSTWPTRLETMRESESLDQRELDQLLIWKVSTLES